MIEKGRHWRALAAGVAAGAAALVGFAGATATAEPVFPQPPVPGPVAVAVAPAAVAPRAPTILPASSGTIAEFFKAENVAMQPQVARDFNALSITLPMPRGWAYIPDPNVPEAFAVIADRVGGDGLYSSNAQLKVYKLIGDFNPDEAISHGFIDSQLLPAWRSTDASLAPYNGMPSSLIEGTYRENSMTLNTSRRHVIASSGPDRYLVSLAVTTTVDQAVAAADATDAIVTGFKVASPTAQPAVAPPPQAPGPAPPPQPLGLP
ncbi:MAG: LpqN/LpqT family lipoprotein [Actinomycetota bacterium]|nr:LpqN/LpqT family lipoprotein [Actinomycetota bacterium]